MRQVDDVPDQLSPCTYLPICVCSRDDALALNRVEPFAVSGDPAATFARLKSLLACAPRTVVVSATDDYLHAACRTRIGFVDDLECRLCLTGGVIHVRSASRLAIWDFGANRRRVEALRRRLRSGYTDRPRAASAQ